MNVRITHKRAPAMALTLAAACAAALPAHASEKVASTQENIGVTTGLVAGAFAGGPVGAIFGAVAGAWLGDRYHKQSVENRMLSTQLIQGETERSKLQSALGEAQTHNDQLAQLLEQRNSVEAQVMFRTKDVTLSTDAVEQLKKMGALAGTMPDMQVRVSGYADVRGSEEFNATLSKERADAVAAVLTSAGLDVSRVLVEAHGKSAAIAAEGDLDGNAFDRRVVVRIEPIGSDAVAQRN